MAPRSTRTYNSITPGTRIGESYSEFVKGVRKIVSDMV